MLMINETHEKFGYDPRSLSRGSDKIVIVKCDYCDTIKEMKNNSRSSSLKNYPKDACKKCSGKKTKDLLMVKYGVTTTQSIPYVKEKTKNTNLKKFGSESFLSSDLGKKKIKKSIIEKYGVEHNMRSEVVQQKRNNIILTKYGVDNVFKLKEFQDIAIEKRIENGSIKVFEGKTIKELAKENNYAYSSMVERINTLGIDMATFQIKQESSLELKMSEIIGELGLSCDKQFRVAGKIADFKIHNSNIIIEADGLYWHSDAGEKLETYHQDKRLTYESNGYRALFFREDEILKKREIVKSIISNSIGNSSRLYARKLEVKEIDFITSKKFIEKNHLMGSTNGVSYSFALLDSDEIISTLQVRKMKGGEYDISRFCSKLGVSVVGGFSKLLSYFIRTCNPKYIQTFIDMRYGTGSYLSKLGFELKSCHKSFKWTDGKNTYHRLKFPKNTGYDAGFYKIWDCGQSKFVKIL